MTALGDFEAPDPGEMCRVVVQDRAVVVFNVEGTLYAVSDICPHRGAVLSEGGLMFGDEGPAVVCPAHGWRFDLRTGDCLHAPDSIAVWDVTEVGGRMTLTSTDNAPPPSLWE